MQATAVQMPVLPQRPSTGRARDAHALHARVVVAAEHDPGGRHARDLVAVAHERLVAGFFAGEHRVAAPFRGHRDLAPDADLAPAVPDGLDLAAQRLRGHLQAPARAEAAHPARERPLHQLELLVDVRAVVVGREA